MAKRTNFRKLVKGILSINNAKLNDLGKRLNKRVVAFDLPAGFTCPAASLCHSRATVNDDGEVKLIDYGSFRCYAAKAESQYKNTREMRHNNLALTQDLESFVERITGILAHGLIDIVRIHASGDMYHPRYYQAWRKIAEQFPNIVFFGYTKMANIARDAQQLNPLANLHIVYSMGGKMDKLALKWNLTTCTVVTADYFVSEDKTQFINHLKVNGLFHPMERITCNVIVSDDYEAILAGESFGIILH